MSKLKLSPKNPVIEFILYVSEQEASCLFYRSLLGLEPVLHVPGMTEFQLSEGCKLGLMPNSGIARILGTAMPHPQNGSGIPRCELYLYVENTATAFEHAVACGAKAISPAQDRDWGDRVCYIADPDGHVIAFAEKGNETMK